MTFLKMSDYEQALYWAQCAIKADPKFIKVFCSNLKGYYRRAIAYLHLMKLSEAKADLLLVQIADSKVSKASSADHDVKAQLAKCNALLREKAFLEAIKVEMLSLCMESIEQIEIPHSYDGPVFNEPISREFVLQMIERFKSDKLIDQKSTLLLMLRAKEYMEKQDALVDIKVPPNARITVCGDTHGQFFDFIQIFDQVSQYPSEDRFYVTTVSSSFSMAISWIAVLIPSK
jgi:serine/threonine-protein phosphatase 5